MRQRAIQVVRTVDAAKRIEELKLPIVATPLGINETKKYTETQIHESTE